MRYLFYTCAALVLIRMTLQEQGRTICSRSRSGSALHRLRDSFETPATNLGHKPPISPSRLLPQADLRLENDQIREDLQAARLRGEVDKEYFSTRLADVERESARQEKEALVTYGMLEGSDPRIAPLRRCLGSYAGRPWCSLDGTSTGANERNETHIWNDVFTQISRTPGDAIPIVAQKSLVGHSKGGSAAWQMIGLL